MNQTETLASCDHKLRSTNRNPYRIEGKPVCDPCYATRMEQRPKTLVPMGSRITVNTSNQVSAQTREEANGWRPETIEALRELGRSRSSRVAAYLGRSRSSVDHRLRILSREGVITRHPGFPAEYEVI